MFYFEANTTRACVFNLKFNKWEKALYVKNMEPFPELSHYMMLPNNCVL